MAVRIQGSYLGNKKVQLTHEPSGMSIYTAAPKDNNGDGSSFSPTDLVAGALGACMLTIMGIYAERVGIDLKGTYFSVEKHMCDSPRRIGSLPVIFHLPRSLSEEHRQKLKNAALTCPVHKSLLTEVQIDLELHFDVE